MISVIPSYIKRKNTKFIKTVFKLSFEKRYGKILKIQSKLLK